MQDARRLSADGITVLVAEPHDLVRRALAEMIAVEPGFAVVGQAADARSAADELRRSQPHLFLFEPAVLGRPGLVQLPRLLSTAPHTRAVVLTDDPSAAMERRAHGLGAVATILKHAAPDDLFGTLLRAVTLSPPVRPAEG